MKCSECGSEFVQDNEEDEICEDCQWEEMEYQAIEQDEYRDRKTGKFDNRENYSEKINKEWKKHFNTIYD